MRLVDDNEVKLSITSSASVIAIQENLSSNCSPLDYSIHPNISLYDFKQSTNTWILAEKEGFDVELIYTLPEDCDVYSGSFYILSNESLSSKETTQQFDEEDSSSGSNGGGASSSRGGGASIPTTSTPSKGIASAEIRDTKDKEEYINLREKARKIIGLQESEQIQTLPFTLIIILAITGIAILLILIILFIKKPSRK